MTQKDVVSCKKRVCRHSFIYLSFTILELVNLEDEIKEVMDLTIHRATLKKDMLEAFSDDKMMSKELKFSIVGFNGNLEDGTGVGVAKKVISSFFNEIYTSFCCGAQELVPILRHDMQRKEWESVARVIVYGTTLEYFPVHISKMFMMSAFQDENLLSNEDLVSSFLNYISQDEKEIIQMFQTEFKSNTEELIDILSSYKCYTNPTKENLQHILFQLAHKEIIQKPRYIASCWNGIFKKIKFPKAFSPSNLNAVYKRATATGRKVASLFIAENMSLEEQTCMEHLRRFVKNLSLENLKRFLKLCTGADVITIEKIEMNFSSLVGAARRPVFRTCGPVLELPNTYTCYSELAEEFQNIMSNPKMAFGFDIC